MFDDILDRVDDPMYAIFSTHASLAFTLVAILFVGALVAFHRQQMLVAACLLVGSLVITAAGVDFLTSTNFLAMPFIVAAGCTFMLVLACKAAWNRVPGLTKLLRITLYLAVTFVGAVFATDLSADMNLGMSRHDWLVIEDTFWGLSSLSLGILFVLAAAAGTKKVYQRRIDHAIVTAPVEPSHSERSDTLRR